MQPLVPDRYALVIVEWHGRGRIVAKGCRSNLLNALRHKQRAGLDYRVVQTGKAVGEYVKL